VGYSGAAELLDEIVVTGASSAGTAGGISAGTAAALAGGAAAGIGGGLAATGGTSATGQAVPVGSSASTTGPSTSAGPGGTSTANKPGFFGNAVKTALVGGAVNEGINVIAGGRRGGVTIPPPPGAAMVDPEGAQAAAMLRARQAVAGGLGSTVTGAGTNQGGFTSATSGGKGLLGQ
jgi:hypothetical protein